MSLYSNLDELNISYERIEHEPVFTVEDARIIKDKLSGVGCKNLFLKAGRVEDYILVVLDERKRADLRLLARPANVSRLSFAGRDELYEILRLYPGAVSPFGIIYDRENRVRIIIDSDLEDKTLLLHPNVNTATLAVRYDDFIKFLDYNGRRYATAKL